MALFIFRAEVVNNSVYPSAGALATESAPRIPPAPSLLSTMNG